MADTSQTATVTTAARAAGLWKVYGDGDTQVAALQGVDFEVRSGEFAVIMGPSGSGKSTLLHCLAGLDTATDGEIWIGDVCVSGLNDRAMSKLRRDSVGFVFQSFNLLPTLTARENILLPLSIAGQRPERAWLDTVIDTVGLRSRLDHVPAKLSGGQQQRVAVARAMIHRPAVIFADEPTGNLDSRSGAEVLDLLRLGVREFGQTVVMVTHDPVAASYGDRIVFLADGRVIDEMNDPEPGAVLDRLKQLDHAETHATSPARQ